MKLGELKLESLIMILPSESLLCDAEDNDTLREKMLELREDSNYSDYLISMPGAFNRCFTSLESKGLVPCKCFNVEKGTLERRGNSLYLDLKKISDVGAVKNIYYYSEHSSPCLCEFSAFGSGILIKDFKDGTFVVEYTPVIKRITNITADTGPIDLPEDLLALIPYFIKSELLREENEKEASLARNTYEAMADELLNKQVGYQASVESVYEVHI